MVLAPLQFSGRSLVPDAMGAVQQGQQILQGQNILESQRLEMQQKQLAQQQAAQQQQQAQNILSKSQSGQRIETVPQFAQLMVSNPELAKRLQAAVGIDSDAKSFEFAKGALAVTQAGNDPQARTAAFQKYAEDMAKLGFDPTDIRNLATADQFKQNQYLAMAQLQALNRGELAEIAKSQMKGGEQTAAQREFSSLTQGLSPEEREKARRISLGLDPRAGISAQERIAQNPTLSGQVSSAAAEEAAAKEEATLKTQLKLKPEVEAAVVSAVAGAKRDADKVAEVGSNQAALDLYDTAMTSLVSALGGTTTGPVSGWLPALTSNQQIADSAVAAMAPILKQMFRSAGEGSFSDSDQALLMGMLPTRSMSPDAIASRVSAMDAIVRSKLKQPQQAQPEPQKAKSGRFIVEVE